MTRKKKYSLDEVIRMDQHLMNLSAYEASNGMTALPADIDEVVQFQKDVKRQFNYFKRLIQCKECTFEDVEQMVIRRNGPVANPYAHMTMSEALNAMMNEEPEEEEPYEQGGDFMQMLAQSLQNSLPDGMVLIGPSGMPVGMPAEEVDAEVANELFFVEPDVASTPEEMHEELKKTEEEPSPKPAKKKAPVKKATKKKTTRKNGDTKSKNQKSKDDIG
jgi:hypothetical protein